MPSAAGSTQGINEQGAKVALVFTLEALNQNLEFPRPRGLPQNAVGRASNAGLEIGAGHLHGSHDLRPGNQRR